MARASKRKLEEAEKKNEKAEEHIKERVEKQKKRFEAQYSEKLQEAKKRAEDRYSYPTYALGAFSFVVTLFYAIDKWEVFKTIPQWFVNRWENIKAIAEAFKTLYLWIHDIIPESWTEIARHAIPIIIFGLIAYFGIYKGLYKALICRLHELNKERWEEYSHRGKLGLKYAFTAFWCAVSLLVSVLIVDIWKDCPLNVLSLYFIFSTLCYILYHTRKENSYSYY